MTSQQKLTEFTTNNPENDDTTGDTGTGTSNSTNTDTPDKGTDEPAPDTFGEYFGTTNTSNTTTADDRPADSESGDRQQQQGTGIGANDTGTDTSTSNSTNTPDMGTDADGPLKPGLEDIDEDQYMPNYGVGAPDGWIAAGDDPRTGPDNRWPKEGRPPEPGETPDEPDIVIPTKKVGATGITEQQLQEYGISEDEAKFMRAVVKSMNRTLEGYDLTESMTDIRSHYDVNEERLVEHGYLKRHTGACRRRYFTITRDGQKACRMTKEHGREIGDLGADTMHRVGIDLARDYYENQDHVRFVELSAPENGNETDLVVVDTDGNRDAIIEVEAGQIPNDPDVTDDRAGIHNYDSIRKDYGILAESDGDAVWVVRNAEVAGTVLRALTSSDDIPVDLPKDIIERVEETKLKIPKLHEKHLDPMDADGIDEIVTFKQLRIRLR